MAALENKRHEIFCHEYLIDLNGAQAAIRAGYAEKGARVEASRLLANPNVHARVEELKALRIQKTDITAEYVLNGLKKVAERCMQAEPVMEWNHQDKRMEQKKDEQGNGVWEFDSTGANRSLELLGRHVGIFEKDNKQKENTKVEITLESIKQAEESLKQKYAPKHS